MTAKWQETLSIETVIALQDVPPSFQQPFPHCLAQCPIAAVTNSTNAEAGDRRNVLSPFWIPKSVSLGLKSRHWQGWVFSPGARDSP